MKNQTLFYSLFLIAFAAMLAGGLYKWMGFPGADWMSIALSFPGFLTFFYLFLRLKKAEK